MSALYESLYESVELVDHAIYDLKQALASDCSTRDEGDISEAIGDLLRARASLVAVEGRMVGAA